MVTMSTSYDPTAPSAESIQNATMQSATPARHRKTPTPTDVRISWLIASTRLDIDCMRGANPASVTALVLTFAD
jgi:hypothetical protein